MPKERPRVVEQFRLCGITLLQKEFETTRRQIRKRGDVSYVYTFHESTNNQKFIRENMEYEKTIGDSEMLVELISKQRFISMDNDRRNIVVNGWNHFGRRLRLLM